MCGVLQACVSGCWRLMCLDVGGLYVVLEGV